MAKSDTKTEPFEATLFKAADKLRKNMDAAEYKHIVLGLIFLKYISDSFETLHNKLLADKTTGADPEDPDEYRAENIFFVPTQTRWNYLLARAKHPSIGRDLDDAMEAIEKENPILKGILPKVFARPNLDKIALGSLIDLISNIELGTEVAKSKDILGRIYEYFLGQFAKAEGKKGGQFYTPKSVVQLMVEMIEPYKGRVYDPCCGSGGMFIMSEKFVESHQGRIDDISIYGQESNLTTYRLCRMNLAIRGIDGSQVKWNSEGSFLNSTHKDLKSDYILANPPFNDSDWSGELLQRDSRWKYGIPPACNANFAWIQHIIYHLSPTGCAGVVLADSATNTTSKDEYNIRTKLINEGLVECMVALPSKLFSNTQITACIWFLRRGYRSENKRHKNEVLFIDASRLGHLSSRKQRSLGLSDIELIASTYNKWKDPKSEFSSIQGLCRSVSYDEIIKNNYNLSPNIYVENNKYTSVTSIGLAEENINWDSFKNLRRELLEAIDSIDKKKGQPPQLSNVWSLVDCTKKLSLFLNRLQLSLVNEYFITAQKSIRDKNLPTGWNIKKFGQLFNERKLTVAEHGKCPAVYSVTNSGIQEREGKFSKELSKSSQGYKVAFYGDMVFGLSREIPNFDVFTEKSGAFSPAYFVYKPNEIVMGLIIGQMMRSRIMDHTDLLKGGAREGRGLDKIRLEDKEFLLPDIDILNKYIGPLGRAGE